MIRSSNTLMPVVFLHCHCCFILHNLVLFISLVFGRFKARYEHAIIQGNDKNATNRQKHIGSNVAKVLILFHVVIDDPVSCYFCV